MNRFLQFANLFGVVALAILCGLQWHANRQLNLELGRVRRTHLAQEARLTEREASLQGYVADLDEFRQQLARGGDRLKETEGRAAAVERELRQLTLERGQLRVSVTNWAAAVAVRDERLKAVQERLSQVARERDAAILKFNELAAKYNTAVKELDAARAKLAPAGPQPSPPNR